MVQISRDQHPDGESEKDLIGIISATEFKLIRLLFKWEIGKGVEGVDIPDMMLALDSERTRAVSKLMELTGIKDHSDLGVYIREKMLEEELSLGHLWSQLYKEGAVFGIVGG